MNIGSWASCRYDNFRLSATPAPAIGFAEGGSAGTLSAEELTLIGNACKVYRTLLKVECTDCAYCMPCPSGVNIPLSISSYNDVVTFKDPTGIMQHSFISPEQRASACDECGECEDKCPQHIPIRKELKKAHVTLNRETGQE